MWQGGMKNELKRGINIKYFGRVAEFVGNEKGNDLGHLFSVPYQSFK